MPVRRDLLLEVGDLDGRLDHAVARRLDQLGQRLEGLARGLPRPDMVLGMAAQRLDDVAARLRSPAELVRLKGERLEARAARLVELLRDLLKRGASDLACHADRLTPELLASRLELVRPRLDREAKGSRTRSLRCWNGRARRSTCRPGSSRRLSHARVLERGYAIVRSAASGRVLPPRRGGRGERAGARVRGRRARGAPGRRAGAAQARGAGPTRPSRAGCCERGAGAGSTGCSR